MATSADRGTQPSVDPEFGKDLDLTTLDTALPTSLKDDGYVAGDLPEHNDINYIGTALTKWIAWIKTSLGFNNTEIDGVEGTYTRRADTGAGKNYPPEDVEDEITPSMDDRIDLKVSTFENSLSETYTPTTQDEFDALDLINQNANVRINTKVTNAIDSIEEQTIYGGIAPDMAVFGSVGENDSGVDGNSYVTILNDTYVRMAKYAATGLDWSNTIIESVLANSSKSVANLQAFIDGSSGADVIRVYDGSPVYGNLSYGFASSQTLSDTLTNNIFILAADGTNTRGIIADTSATGSNAVTKFRTIHSIDAEDDVWIRRLCTTKVIEISSGRYRFLQLEHVGDEAVYSGLKTAMRDIGLLSDPTDTLSPVVSESGGSINFTEYVPTLSGAIYSYRMIVDAAGTTNPYYYLLTGSLDHFMVSNTDNVENNGIFKDRAKVFAVTELGGGKTSMKGIPLGHTDKRIY